MSESVVANLTLDNAVPFPVIGLGVFQPALIEQVRS